MKIKSILKYAEKRCPEIQWVVMQDMPGTWGIILQGSNGKWYNAVSFNTDKVPKSEISFAVMAIADSIDRKIQNE